MKQAPVWFAVLLVGAITGTVLMSAFPALAQTKRCALTNYSGRISEAQYLEARKYIGQKGRKLLDLLGMPYCSFDKTFVYLLHGRTVQVIFGDGIVLEVTLTGRFK